MTLFLILTGVLLLLFFAVPVRIGGEGAISDEGTTFKAWVRLLGWVLGVDVVYDGALSWRLKVGPASILTKAIGGKQEGTDRGETSGKRQKEKKQKEKKPRKRSEQSFLGRVRAGFSLYERFRDPLISLLRNVLRSVWFRRLQVDGNLGMGAADATGRMMGYVYAAEGILGRRVEIDIQPDFLERGFKGTVRFEIWLWFGFLIAAVLFAALTIGIRYAVWYLLEKLARSRRPKPQTA